MTWHLDQEVAIFSELRELLPTTGLDFELMEIGGRAVRHLKKTNDFFETPCFFLIVGKFKGTYIYIYFHPPIANLREYQEIADRPY